MSNFELITEKKNDIFILRSKGYLAEDDEGKIFSAVGKAIEEGFHKIILDLAQSPVINSQGIAQVIELSEIVIDEIDGELAFIGLSELSMRVFKMVGLLQMGDVYASEEEAIENLTD